MQSRALSRWLQHGRGGLRASAVRPRYASGARGHAGRARAAWTRRRRRLPAAMYPGLICRGRRPRGRPERSHVLRPLPRRPRVLRAGHDRTRRRCERPACSPRRLGHVARRRRRPAMRGGLLLRGRRRRPLPKVPLQLHLGIRRLLDRRLLLRARLLWQGRDLPPLPARPRLRSWGGAALCERATRLVAAEPTRGRGARVPRWQPHVRRRLIGGRLLPRRPQHMRPWLGGAILLRLHGCTELPRCELTHLPHLLAIVLLLRSHRRQRGGRRRRVPPSRRLHARSRPPPSRSHQGSVLRWESRRHRLSSEIGEPLAHRRPPRRLRLDHPPRQGEAPPRLRPRHGADGRRVPDPLPSRLPVPHLHALQPAEAAALRMDPWPPPELPWHPHTRSGVAP